MGLFGRSGPAEAVYARAVDGEHLWLAVRGDGPLGLVGDGVELPVVTETEEHPDGPLQTAVVPVAALLAGSTTADVVTLRLVAGRRRTPVAWAVPRLDPGPALLTPTTLDGRWQLSVEEAGGEVVVRRTRLSSVAQVAGITGGTDGAGGGLRIALTDGAVLTAADLPDVDAGRTQALTHDGLPLLRARNVVERPNAAVGLPSLGDGRELRWLKDGRLAVHRRPAGTEGPS